MIHSRIDSGTLRDRLDASYYTPEVLENEAQLQARGSIPLQSLIDTDGSNYGVLPPSVDYLPSGSGVPLIRGGDLDGGTIRDPEIDVPFSFKTVRGTANVGDVLLLIKGACIDSPAGVALVYPRHAGNVFNGSCYRVKLTSACDSGFLVAYCQTRQLLLQKKREIANTGIAYNAEDSVLGYLVPAFSPNVQRYIGDKVRQTELLRERARATQARLNRLITVDAVEAALAAFDSRSSRLPAQDLRHRLDSKFYGRRALSVYRACADDAGVKVGDLNPRISNGFEYRQFTPEGRPYLTVSEMSSGRLELANAPRIPWDIIVPEKACITTACVLVVRGGSIGFAACVHSEDTSAAVSSDLIRLEFDSEWKAAAVGLFLNSAAGRCLQHKVSYGGVMSKLGQDELLDIPIPGSILARADDLFRCFNKREAASRSSSRLASAAKLLVEQLINGHLTEAELAVAQTALDAGDRSADREILKALRQSDSPGGQPLIADVDGLYALLDDSEGLDP